MKKLFNYILFFIFTCGILFSQEKEYSLTEKLSFHRFGIGFGFSSFEAVKEPFNKNFVLSSPGIKLFFGFTYRIFPVISCQLDFQYSEMKSTELSNANLKLPEAGLNLIFDKAVWNNFFISAGLGAGGCAAMTSSEIQTVNDNKILIGSRTLTKIKYGNYYSAILSLKYFFNEINGLEIGARYSYTQIGKPEADGLGNLGGYAFFLKYFYNF